VECGEESPLSFFVLSLPRLVPRPEKTNRKREVLLLFFFEASHRVSRSDTKKKESGDSSPHSKGAPPIHADAKRSNRGQ
jgi:hypothetical protein